MFTAKQKTPQPQQPVTSAESKEAAKNCLHAADKYLKDGDFEKAKEQIAKAKELDPSNAYIYAFQDRVEYFEQLKKKEIAQVKTAPPVTKPTPEPAEKKESSAVPPPAPKMPMFTPPPTEPEHTSAPIFPMTPSSHQPSVQTTSSPPVSSGTVSQSPKYTPPPVESRQASSPAPDTRPADSMLMDMKRQIGELSRALEQEKRAREEISSRQLHSAVRQYRSALEKAWVNGAPPEKEAQELHRLATSLGIPEEVEGSTTREVKLEAYSKAVKEMIAKRKLLKSSSSTMEWLRKVYQVSLTEYLENESKFLLDLVADQFKGTMIYVTSDPNAKNTLVPKLKMAGFAVVVVPNPESALEKIEKINPNIVLCETEFPDGSLSGLKFLHVLRVSSKFNFFPFVLLCDAKEITHLQSSELKPNEGFVKKPIDFDELSNVMNEKLAQFREYISSL